VIPQTILEIVKLSLELTLEVMRGIPVESRQAMWKEHEKRMEFWQKLFDRFDRLEPDKGKP